MRYYDQNVGKVYGYAYHMTDGNVQTAQDVTSEVFRKALEAFGRFKGDDQKATSWFLTIAANYLRNSHRNFQRHPVTNQDMDTLHTQSPDPLNIVIQNEETQELLRNVRQLPPLQQNVVVLKFALDLSNKAVAEILETTEGAVKSHYHRALVNLRKQKK